MKRETTFIVQLGTNPTRSQIVFAKKLEALNTFPRAPRRLRLILFPFVFSLSSI
jgi:hypothetical protein